MPARYKLLLNLIAFASLSLVLFLVLVETNSRMALAEVTDGINDKCIAGDNEYCDKNELEIIDGQDIKKIAVTEGLELMTFTVDFYKEPSLDDDNFMVYLYFAESSGVADTLVKLTSDKAMVYAKGSGAFDDFKTSRAVKVDGVRLNFSLPKNDIANANTKGFYYWVKFVGLGDRVPDEISLRMNYRLNDPNCNDVDGEDYYLQSYVYISGKALAFKDECIEGDVWEGICVDGKQSTKRYVCSNGCKNGACLPDAKPANFDGVCSDTDGGKDFNNKGTARQADGAIGTDYCTDVSRLMEHWCDGGKLYSSLHTCEHDCLDGACVANTNTQTSCTKSDGGRSYYIFGHGQARDLPIMYDYCIDPQTLNEANCVNGLAYEKIVCPNGCKDGACITSDKVVITNVLLRGSYASVGEKMELIVGLKNLSNESKNGLLVKAYDQRLWGSEVLVDILPGGAVYASIVMTPTDKQSTYNPHTFKVQVGDGDIFSYEVEILGAGTCRDNEGGRDHYKSGSIITNKGIVTTTYDYCIGEVLHENYCDKGGQMATEEFNCPFGCFSGRCVAEKPESDFIKNVNDWIVKVNALLEKNGEDLFRNLKISQDINKENEVKDKYLKKIETYQQIKEDYQKALANFVTYGADINSNFLGTGERAAVVHSFKTAYGRLPESETDLTDLVKIANGSWPTQKSVEAENRAKEQFRKIFKRIADMNDAFDNAAITIMAYGLKQRAENRNLESEKRGIIAFRNLYGSNPNTTEDWNVMQAITYSGSSRLPDKDKDLLPDDRELKIGSDPANPDSDNDGYSDGIEVENNFNPNGAGSLD
jgi:hypothetical protein